MPLYHPIPLDLNADQVLSAQGADPVVIRRRSPALVHIAEEAISIAAGLLDPRAAYCFYSIEGARHETLLLKGMKPLRSALLSRQLSGSERLAAVTCTIGSRLEEQAAVLMKEDAPLALALDGAGTAAVNTLAAMVCRSLADGELDESQKAAPASLPFSPGLEGWPIDPGQFQLFELLAGEPTGIRLLPSGMMSPRKSTSFVVGLGGSVDSSGKSCDYCSLKATCRYQEDYA